ncbi:MAG: hypothetical protein ACRCVZ_12435, partial [Aestuariivirga sp.]
MTNAERALITNAIWLCRDCHGLVDKDPQLYPAELLFRWKSSRENEILRKLGKAGDIMRIEAARHEIDQLGNIPTFV